MKIDSCPETEKVIQAVRSASWPARLRRHVETCACCRETSRVVLRMTELAANLESLAGAAPDPGLIWLKARISRRARLPGLALLPLKAGTLLGCAGLSLLLAAVPESFWHRMQAWRPDEIALAQLQYLTAGAPATCWWIPVAAVLLSLLAFTASEA